MRTMFGDGDTAIPSRIREETANFKYIQKLFGNN